MSLPPLLRLTPTASAGVLGTVDATVHFRGTPPGAISAVPQAGPVAYLYWALIALGVALLGTAAFLAIRWRQPRGRSRHGASPQPMVTFAPHPATQPAPAYPGQPGMPGVPQAAPPWAVRAAPPDPRSASWEGQPDPWSAYPAPPQPQQPRPAQQQRPPARFPEPPYPTRPNTSPWYPPVPPAPTSQPAAPPGQSPLQQSPHRDRPPWEQPPWEPPSEEPPAKPRDSPGGWFDPR